MGVDGERAVRDLRELALQQSIEASGQRSDETEIPSSIRNRGGIRRGHSTCRHLAGKHCPMCSTAHGWAGPGPSVYAASSAQLSQRRAGWGLETSVVDALSISAVAPGIRATGPSPEFEEELKMLHDPHRTARE